MRSFVRGALRSSPVLALISFLIWSAQPAAAQEGDDAAAGEVVCADCHDDVHPEALENTVHAGLSCTDCHTEAADLAHAEGANPGLTRVDCATCHSDTVDALRKSIHGKPVFTQISGKPACQTCHGPVHQIMPHDDPASRVNP